MRLRERDERWRRKRVRNEVEEGGEVRRLITEVEVGVPERGEGGKCSHHIAEDVFIGRNWV